MNIMGGAGDAPTKEEFTAAGIKHLCLACTACAPMTKKPQRDLSGEEGDIKRLGAVTGTARRADALVAGMREKGPARYRRRAARPGRTRGQGRRRTDGGR